MGLGWRSVESKQNRSQKIHVAEFSSYENSETGECTNTYSDIFLQFKICGIQLSNRNIFLKERDKSYLIKPN